jgi:2-succinyl-6-hydroxy-2,4-cyclohexadiene-1-carboxylate synthase
LVLVPGFTQSATSWDPVLDARGPGWWLDQGFDVTAIDVPDGLEFAATATALGEQGGPGVYVGYSMGGRLCLQLALDRPDVVERLVLVSATPGIADEAERAARRAADEDLALGIERDGVDAFLERWLAQPMFASLSPEAAGADARRRSNTVARLTHQLRALGQGTQPSNWSRLEELAARGLPTALFVGRRDTKYLSIAEHMADPLHANLRVIGDAGHACHLEDPASFCTLLRSWLLAD